VLTHALLTHKFQKRTQGLVVDLLLGWERFRCPLVGLTLASTGVSKQELAFLVKASPLSEGIRKPVHCIAFLYRSDNANSSTHHTHRRSRTASSPRSRSSPSRRGELLSVWGEGVRTCSIIILTIDIAMYQHTET
jgi:hypothetical protein